MSRSQIPATLRHFVYQRAKGKCEYCLIHEDDTPFTHHIDHIIPIRHNGQTIRENLALACPECNWNKGTDLTTFDPLKDEITLLFNPRNQAWNEHFRLENARIIGITPVGRATEFLLRLNDPARITERRALSAVGRYPKT